MEPIVIQLKCDRQTDKGRSTRAGRSHARLAALVMLTAHLAVPAWAAQGEKVTLAVLDFNIDAVHDGWEYGWPPAMMGTTAASNLSAELAKEKVFRVIERSSLGSVLEEQDLGSSQRFDMASAARIGRLLGAQVVVLGDVVEFGHSQVGGSGAGILDKLKGKWISGSLSITTVRAKLRARLVDVVTAEILDTFDGRGSKSFGAGAMNQFAGGTQYDSGQVSKVLAEAVEELAGAMAKRADSIQPTRICLEGDVARVAGAEILLNLGSIAGVSKGDRFEVHSVGDAITNPGTGEVIGHDERTIGRVEIVEVKGAKLSAARPIEGGGFERGQHAQQTAAPGKDLKCTVAHSLPTATASLPAAEGESVNGSRTRVASSDAPAAGPSGSSGSSGGGSGGSGSDASGAAVASADSKAVGSGTGGSGSAAYVGIWLLDAEETSTYWFKQIFKKAPVVFGSMGPDLKGSKKSGDTAEGERELRKRNLRAELRADHTFTISMQDPADGSPSSVGGTWEKKGAYLIVTGLEVDGLTQKEPYKQYFKEGRAGRLFGQPMDPKQTEGLPPDSEDASMGLAWPHIEGMVLMRSSGSAR